MDLPLCSVERPRSRYNEKQLVLKVPPRSATVPDPVMGLRFGRFGREDGVLVSCYKSGALSVKILPRRTNFNITGAAGPPPEQNIPLKVPKKTRLYVDQTQREREQAVAMHRKFQRDLCRLRLETARSYVKMITDGHGPSTYMAGANIRVNAMVRCRSCASIPPLPVVLLWYCGAHWRWRPQVAGLGPHFKLKIQMRNSGSRSVSQLGITFYHSHTVYTIEPGHMTIPLLLPAQVRESLT